jgi:cell division topological specificity factor
MSLWDFFKKRQPNSASVAKERLQVIIASEGHGGGGSELVQQIKQAVVEAISKFVHVSPGDISVERDTRDQMEMLSVSITLPEKLEKARKAFAPPRERVGSA